MVEFIKKGIELNNVKIKTITSVLSPDKVFKFEQKWRELKEQRGEKETSMQNSPLASHSHSWHSIIIEWRKKFGFQIVGFAFTVP